MAVNEMIKAGAVSCVEFRVSRDMVEAFSKLTGDSSPLHIEADFARRSIYREPVVHGMLPVSFLPALDIFRIEGCRLDVREITGRFTGPVFAGDVLRLQAEITGFDAGNSIIDAAYSVIKAKTNSTVTAGTVSLMLSESGPIKEHVAPSPALPLVNGQLEPMESRFEEIQKGAKDSFSFTLCAGAFMGLVETYSCGLDGASKFRDINRYFGLDGLLCAMLFSTSVGMGIPGRYATFLEFSAKIENPVCTGEDFTIESEVVHLSRATRIIKKAVTVRQAASPTPAVTGKVSVMVNQPSSNMPSIRALRENALDLGLKDKVVIVTGASRGIGETTAKLFALHGSKVVVNFFRGSADADRIVSEIKAEGAEAFAFKADVSDDAQVREMVKAAVERFGRVDVLVNNAVRDFRPVSFLKLTWDEVEKDMDVTVKGAFNCCKEAVPVMMGNGGGTIINLSTVAAENPPANQAKYVITKSALVGLTRSLAVDLAPHNIRVNMVVPNFVETDLVSHIPEAYRKKIAEENLIRRNASPADVAQAIVFLASRYSSFTTGQKVMVTGGGPYL